jgi:hypothetical protein
MLNLRPHPAARSVLWNHAAHARDFHVDVRHGKWVDSGL